MACTTKAFVVLVMLCCSGALQATNGLYSLSYGARSAGMAGATLASGDSALGQIVNPASMSSSHSKFDFNITYLRSNLRFRNALNDTENGRGFSGYPFSDNNFFIPAFGYVRPIEESRLTLGFQVFGLGGDAARFVLDDFAPPAGFGSEQVFRGNLALITFGPSASYEINQRLTVGLTAQITAARLKLNQPFGTFAPPSSVRFKFRFDMPDFGFHYAAGVRAGMRYQITPKTTFAAAYQSPRAFNLDGDVRILFPAGTGLGDTQSSGTIPLTLPHQFDLGMAVRVVPEVLLEIDYSWIGWASQDPFESFNVHLSSPPAGFPATLAAPLRWRDQHIARIGSAYEVTPAFSVRAGYAYGSNPVRSSGAFLTFPAYGFHSLTVGASWQASKKWNISFAFERSFPRTVRTRASSVDAFHDNSSERHDQYSAQLEFSRSF